MTTQPDLFDTLTKKTPPLFPFPDETRAGMAARDAGEAKVSQNTPDYWKAQFDVTIAQLAASGRRFTIDDVREQVGPPPNHCNAVGSRVSRAIRSGMIRRDGNDTIKSKRKSRHSAPLWIYVGVNA